jgi:rifampicin phosphotransferase
VITDPSTAVMEQGDIIVARRTDPGWILLFPAASGLIVEHGSLLSHSAIVSRELGLPAIVGVCNATQVLKDGDLVEFDGKTGYIEIVERAEAGDVLAA